MPKAEDGSYTNLTPEQWEAGVSFCRDKTLPFEYGTHLDNQPNLYVKPMTDEDPTTPEWDEETTAEFEAAIS